MDFDHSRALNCWCSVNRCLPLFAVQKILRCLLWSSSVERRRNSCQLRGTVCGNKHKYKINKQRGAVAAYVLGQLLTCLQMYFWSFPQGTLCWPVCLMVSVPVATETSASKWNQLIEVCLLFPFHHHYMCPGVANRTKPNQKRIEPNRTQSNPIEPNRTQSFDWSSIGSAIEHNRTGTSLRFWLSSNSIDAIGSILFCRKTKWYTKLISISFLVELEGMHSLTEF